MVICAAPNRSSKVFEVAVASEEIFETGQEKSNIFLEFVVDGVKSNKSLLFTGFNCVFEFVANENKSST